MNKGHYVGLDKKGFKTEEEYHEMVRPSGLEPPTPTMSRWCSNQLSYGRIMLSVTTGSNISGSEGMRQEGKCNFLPYFTRLLHSRAK